MKDSQQPWEIVRELQQLYGTGRDSERQPATIGNSERYAGTTYDWRDSERQPATIEDSKRHAATPWNPRDSKRQ